MSNMAKEKKKRIRSLRTHVANALDFPAQAMFGVSVIEIQDFSVVHVRGCNGISVYSETEITLNLKKQAVHIAGERLSLRRISNEEIAVDGAIRTINLID